MSEIILAVGAHPDDVELGCGGTLSKHLEAGDEVFVLIMTNGEMGNHTGNREECLNSLKNLGVKEENIIFGNFSDGFLSDDQKTVNFIEDYINKLNATRVYTHYPDDRHQDHRNCSKAVSSAARKIPELLLFQGPSTKPPFEPHYFVELSKEHLRKKIYALGSYESQIRKMSVFSLRWVECCAGLNGGLCNTEHAEAFAINHLLKRGKNV